MKRSGMFISSASLYSSLSESRVTCLPGSAMLLHLSLSSCSGSSTCISEWSTLLLIALCIQWLSSCYIWSCNLSSAIRLRTTLYWLSFYYIGIWENQYNGVDTWENYYNRVVLTLTQACGSWLLLKNALIMLSHVCVALKWYKRLMRISCLLLPIVLGGSG